MERGLLPHDGRTRDRRYRLRAPDRDSADPVFNGNDDFHPAPAAEALHEAIPGSRLLPCAWTRDDWMLRYVGRIPESVVELYPRMSEAIIDYIREVEHLT